jgi:hypothetical protein
MGRGSERVKRRFGEVLHYLRMRSGGLLEEGRFEALSERGDDCGGLFKMHFNVRTGPLDLILHCRAIGTDDERERSFTIYSIGSKPRLDGFRRSDKRFYHRHCKEAKARIRKSLEGGVIGECCY